MLLELKRRIRANFAGISWKDPWVRRVLPLLDFLDGLLRQVFDRGHLPRFSIRIRSTGISGQFGGKEFVESGAHMVSLIGSITDVKPDTCVLEIGCGCGRTAFALVDYLKHGCYTGIDVDPVAIDACKHNLVLARAGFRFLQIDVENDIYNPEGHVTASEYVFPFPQETFDLVFLHSVFTHMLPEEVEHYIEEIGRVLRPGGYCIFSTFLTDFGIGQSALSFPYDYGSCRLHQTQTPRKAVAYPLDYFNRICSELGVLQREAVEIGTWRQDTSIVPDTTFFQDFLVLYKLNQ
jgi:SAM-dependent methyltransferase